MKKEFKIFVIDRTDRGITQKIFFEVVVAERRSVFGRSDVKVIPIFGYGEMWVSESSLREKK